MLIQRHPHSITVTEVFLYIWIAAFAYDEFGEFQDAGAMFYQTDFWSLWDLGIIFSGVAFLIVRKCTRRVCPGYHACFDIALFGKKRAERLCAGAIGLLRGSDYLIDISFDTLALLALFLVPRSVL